MHVVYGLIGLKTHAKTALVVREEGDGIRRYCHIGTGNYNSSTARLYEDIGILTASPGARGGPYRPVQLPHRLQPPVGLPPTDRRTPGPAVEDNRAHPAREPSMAAQADRVETEQPC